MSARTKIRQKIFERLIDKTGAAERVYQNRIRQLWPEELPAILIYTRSETARDFDSAPRSIERELQVAVEVVAAADESLEDTLDEIAEQVENRLIGDDTLGGVCSDIILTGTEMSVAGEGETIFGSAILNFRVLYHTNVYLRDVEFDDLDGFNADWNARHARP